MTHFEKTAVLNAANAARVAGRKAHPAAIAARTSPCNADAVNEAELAALRAYRAAQAAEDAALDLDPEEALENEDVWRTHCIAMGAADYAHKRADNAISCAR
ncbi:hypothetical protein LJC74_05055 [Eubacteriales bacterium OttesenSCG-928-A19]|nr:hypothetical protein [Eubacteriales bacterium OttesenSCG-928-A19]